MEKRMIVSWQGNVNDLHVMKITVPQGTVSDQHHDTSPKMDTGVIAITAAHPLCR